MPPGYIEEHYNSVNKTINVCYEMLWNKMLHLLSEGLWDKPMSDLKSKNNCNSPAQFGSFIQDIVKF